MSLESATYINQLNPLNPDGAVDLVSTADDHLKLIKSTLQNTFPNITGPVLADQNALSGSTFLTDTGTANAIIVTPVPAWTAYTSGNGFSFIAAATSTSNAVTIKVNSLATTAVTNADGSPAIITANSIYTVKYNGTSFILINAGSVKVISDTITYTPNSLTKTTIKSTQALGLGANSLEQVTIIPPYIGVGITSPTTALHLRGSLQSELLNESVYSTSTLRLKSAFNNQSSIYLSDTNNGELVRLTSSAFTGLELQSTAIVGAAISGTAGTFTFTSASITLAIGQSVIVSGTALGTGSITGFVNSTTYFIIATNGTSTFTLSATLGGTAITTVVGTCTGLTFTVPIMITGTGGQFLCASVYPIAIGQAVNVQGTLTGTGTITGYTSPKTYYVIATNGSTTFQLSATLGGSALTTTVGSTIGLTFGLSSLSTPTISSTSGTIAFTGPGFTTTNGQTVTVSGTMATPTLTNTSSVWVSGTSTLTFTTTVPVGYTLTVGAAIKISGTTTRITGYTDPTTYYIIATNGSTTFVLSTTPTGTSIVGTTSTIANYSTLTFTIIPIVGYSNPSTYYIVSTNGSTSLQLSSTVNGTPITTFVGATTGLLFNVGASAGTLTIKSSSAATERLTINGNGLVNVPGAITVAGNTILNGTTNTINGTTLNINSIVNFAQSVTFPSINYTGTLTGGTGQVTIGTNRFTIKASNGYVGIGTATPAAQLSVNGGIFATGSINGITETIGDISTNMASTEFVYDNQFPVITKTSRSGYNSFIWISNGKAYESHGTGGVVNYTSGRAATQGQAYNFGFENGAQIPIPSLSLVVDAGGCSQSTAYALLEDGSLYTWGDNTYGSLGLGTTTYTGKPTLAATSVAQVYWNPSSISGLYSDGSRMIIQKTDGTIWGAGYNVDGQLGIGNTTNQSTFQQITGAGTYPVYVANNGGRYGNLIIQKSDNTIWAAGYNVQGQLGDGTIVSKSSLVDVSSAWQGGNTSMVIQNVCGGYGAHDGTTARGEGWTAMLLGDGSTTLIKTSGYGGVGSLGNSGTANISSPATITAGAYNITKLISNNNRYGTVYALNTNGDVYSWGYNGYGQVGDGTTTAKLVPYLVLTTVANIWTASSTSTVQYASQIFYSKVDLTLWVNGYNGHGECGVGSVTNQLTPAQVWIPYSAAADIKDITYYSTTAACNSIFLITNKNVVYAWGSNNNLGIVENYAQQDIYAPLVVKWKRGE